MNHIREIKASEWIDRAWPMAIEHWREVAEVTGMPVPSIDRGTLAKLEEYNLLLTLGAFHNDEIVGYSLNVIGNAFNCDTLKMCTNQGLYVRQAHRGSLALRLIRATERGAKALGCTRLEMHTYRATGADELFSRLGYTLWDHPYIKDL